MQKSEFTWRVHIANSDWTVGGAAMPSIKQIEAFYWSGQLGSFVAAADRLNTTQSNISKRIQELEYTLGVELFDRAKRAIRMTAKGDELMRLSDELLRTHMRLRQVGKSALAVDGPFRFGVTEAVALTWLPRFSAVDPEQLSGADSDFHRRHHGQPQHPACWTARSTWPSAPSATLIPA